MRHEKKAAQHWQGSEPLPVFNLVFFQKIFKQKLLLLSTKRTQKI